MKRPIEVLLVTCSILLPTAANASERGWMYPPGGRHLTFAAACADPASRTCDEALKAGVVPAAAALVELAQHRHPQAPLLAALAADSGFPELRIASAEALGYLSVDAPNDAVLAELLDDPVPAVRRAAATALAGSNDPHARQLSQRAGQFPHGDETSLAAETSPNPASLGVPLPSDAVFVYFASNPADGRYAFVTAESPAKVIARLPKGARGPIAPADFRAAVEPETSGAEAAEMPSAPADGEMPSAEDLAKAMAMATKVMTEMNAHPGGTMQEQAAHMAKAMGHAVVNSNLGESYESPELFGDARLYLVEMANGLDATVAVYRDNALGLTGVSVHRVPSQP